MNLRTLLATVICALATCYGNAQTTMTINAAQRGPLTSPYQWGLFFEEINHAGDGGLYAELVRNRSFEEGLDSWEPTVVDGDVGMAIITEGLMNGAQGACLRMGTLNVTKNRPQGVRNTGFWGMKFEKGKTYALTLWAKGSTADYSGNITARLVKGDGTTAVGEATLSGEVYTDRWNQLTATIKATDSDNSGQLLLLTGTNGYLDLDVVSLFPETWKGRKNGLRPDLAQLLADTKPTFLRFPGGCYVEGEGTFDNAFQWKKTIGPIEQRPGHMNQNWRYWSTDGLGFDEYLQLAEDMGAAPMFVVNVGLGHGFYIPLADLDTLVQNTLDAIEYANGDGSTYWGAQRIKNGHVAPYNLKFIEIGNENYQSDGEVANAGSTSYQYPERYYMFYKAIKEKYPEIVTIGNVEAWGTDAPTWRNDYPVELVDEHYYRTSAWMRDNYNKYDNYPRNIGVYNGEYAANSGDWGRYGNLNAALGEAIYMLGQERNSDVCRMGSFAPIFTHEMDPRWAYDMIHFNAGGNFVTPSYYVQKLMANNVGYQNLKWTETGNTLQGVGDHQVGLATWDTQASYKDLKLTDGATGAELYNGGTFVYKQISIEDSELWTKQSGNWSFNSGEVSQTANGQPCRMVCNQVFRGGDYAMEVKARKDGGAEAFLIVFDYQDEQNYAWWNIGGWGNTKNAIEVCRNGSKSQYSTVSYSIEEGQWYDLKVAVYNSSVKCYINGQLIHELSLPTERALYQSCQLTEDGSEMILKVVNPNSTNRTLRLDCRNMTISDGTVIRLTSEKGTDENTMDAPDKVKPSEPEVARLTSTLTIPAFSLNIFRFPVSNLGEEVKAKTAADYPEYVEEDRDKVAYLFAHMHQSSEHTCFALSKDGQVWNDLLDSQEVFDTKANTVTGGMRDAFVYRLQSGSGFMLVGTDMTSRLGWESNHIMDLMLSPDLVHWTKNVKIDLETPENLQAISNALGKTITEETMTAAWAPQVIYDSKSNKYVLYYSVGIKGDKHYIFYQLIDEQLNILTEPRIYFAPGYDVIDADIIYNAVDHQYQMLFKCESTNGFDRATAERLVPGEGETGTTVWTITSGFHIGEDNQAIEGMSMWRPIGELKWRLGYQNYSSGTYGYKLRYMDEHCMAVDAVGHYMAGNVSPQHGSFLKLTQQEYDYLLSWRDQQRQELIDRVVADGQGDLTALIDNADFAAGSSGWSSNTTFTAANGRVAEFFNKNFDFWQDLEGLPNGEYEVGVQAFYRNGPIDAYLKYQGDVEQLNSILYANSDEVPVVSLFSESSYTVSPYTFPDNVGQAHEAFNEKDLYHNKLRVTVTDGRLRLGIRKEVYERNDWCCFDNFTLTYLGTGSGIVDAGFRSVADGPAYSLMGQRIKIPGKGIYIKGGKKILK